MKFTTEIDNYDLLEPIETYYNTADVSERAIDYYEIADDAIDKLLDALDGLQTRNYKGVTRSVFSLEVEQQTRDNLDKLLSVLTDAKEQGKF